MFFIFDHAGNTVGNPKGYATMRGASQQANTRKLQNIIWARFDARADKSETLVWQIIQPFGDVPGVANFAD